MRSRTLPPVVCLAALAAIWGLGIASARCSGQTKSVVVRGQKVELEVESRLMVVHPKGGAKAAELTKAAVDAQASLLRRSAGPLILQMTKNPPKALPHGKGVIVPRLPGLQSEHLARMAGMSDAIASTGEVYRLGKHLVAPLGTLTVRFRSAPSARTVTALAAEFRLEETGRPKFAPNMIRFRPTVDDADLFAICETLAARANIAWAEPDVAAELVKAETEARTPNDPLIGEQWHLKSGPEGINLPEAWAISTGGEQEFIVAVIDDGVDMNHTDLKDKLLPGYDFLDMDEDPQPAEPDAHGTSCAGLIGAMSNNGVGISGVCWTTKILPVRICGPDNDFTTSDLVAESILFSQEKGARVISCSWSYTLPVNIICDAVDIVHEKGCLMLAAAANDGEDETFHYVHFPAAFQPVMAIGAVRPDNTRWGFSCYGPQLSICAPSSDSQEFGIWTTDHSGANGYNTGGGDTEEETGDYTGWFGGTSAATPITAGVAALVWSNHPELTNIQVREILESTATKIDEAGGNWRNGRSHYYGAGKVDALAALKRAAEVAGASTSRTGGRPPFPSNFYVPKAIDDESTAEVEPQAALRGGMTLEAALNPQAGSYSVRGVQVELKPAAEWIAVEIDREPSENESSLWRVVKAPKAEALPELRAAFDGKRNLVVVPKSLVHGPEHLAKLAEERRLPPLFPVYEHNGSQAVMLGAVLLKAENEAAMEAITKFAEEQGMKSGVTRRDVIRFEFGAACTFKDSFAAVAALAQRPGVVWCEPVMALELRKIEP